MIDSYIISVEHEKDWDIKNGDVRELINPISFQIGRIEIVTTINNKVMKIDNLVVVNFN